MTEEKRRPEGNRAAPEKTLVGDSDKRSADQHRRRAAMAAATSVLAKCAANDSTVPKPNEASARAWAEHIFGAGLEYNEDLLLQAVTRVYSTAHSDNFRLLPAHVITAARELREEAGMREPTAVREARQAARDKVLAAAEEAADQAAAADGMQPIPRGASPFTVACHHPPCSAPPGRPCTAPTLGRERERVLSYSRAHPNRIARAAAERERDSPQAQRAAEEAARQDAKQALSRYHEHPQKPERRMNGAERGALYRLDEQLAARPIDEGDAP